MARREAGADRRRRLWDRACRRRVLRRRGAQVAVLERDATKCETLRAEHPDVSVLAGDATSARTTRMQSRWLSRHTEVSTSGQLRRDLRLLPGARRHRRRSSRRGVRRDVQRERQVPAAQREGRDPGFARVGRQRRAHRIDLRILPGPGGTLYVASKFAVRGLVTTLAYELAPSIRVNGVAPGGTLSTDLRGLATFGLNTERLDDTPDREADLASRNPLQGGALGPRPLVELRLPGVRPGTGGLRQRHPHRRRHVGQGVVATRRQIRSRSSHACH